MTKDIKRIPLSIDDDDLAAADSIADKYSARAGVPTSAPASPRAAPVADDRPAPPPPAAPKPAKSTDERLSVTLPGYVLKAMQREAFEDDSSARYIILKGLKAIGYAVDAADLVKDRRRPK